MVDTKWQKMTKKEETGAKSRRPPMTRARRREELCAIDGTT